MVYTERAPRRQQFFLNITASIWTYLSKKHFCSTFRRADNLPPWLRVAVRSM